MTPGTISKVIEVLTFVQESLRQLPVGPKEYEIISKNILLIEGQILILQDSLSDQEIKAELEYLGIDTSKAVENLKRLLHKKAKDKR
jgi:hypothetical protein